MVSLSHCYRNYTLNITEYRVKDKMVEQNLFIQLKGTLAKLDEALVNNLAMK